MKFSVAAVLALAGLSVSSPVSAPEPGLEKRASHASVSGLKFNIDGTVRYFAGTNTYWIAFLSNPADIDLTMNHVAASGLKVLRVWGFNDVSSQSSGVWFQSFVKGQNPQINTGPNGLQKLDKVVAAAEKYNVKLIVNFVNNWGDYGGMPVYNAYYGTTKTTWYTNTAVQTQYKAYINAVVSRYKSSTAIFAWELANEPRCNGCPTSIITNWAKSTSAYIKSLDSNHMVTLGDEGWMNGGGDGTYPYTTTEGVDFQANLKISTLDFGTFHLYPISWGITEQPGGNNFITAHGRACIAANKPCILEEYGSVGNKIQIEGSWQSSALSSPGIAGDMVWQWGENLSTGKSNDDGNAIYYKDSNWSVLVQNHVKTINAGSPATTSAARTTTYVPTSTTARVSTSSSNPLPSTSNATSRTTTTASSKGDVPRWGQCGGQGYGGSTSCQSPWVCTVSNQWYSQCL